MKTPFNYYNYKEAVKLFFRCSLKNDFTSFDFEEAFNVFKEPINTKLAEHGQKDYDDFVESNEDLYCDYDLSAFCIQTNYIYLDEDEIKEFIFKGMYEKYKETFEGYFTDLEKIISDVENMYSLDLPQKIQLFDRMIHAQHVTGDIFEDFDPDDLREEVEEEIAEEA